MATLLDPTYWPHLNALLEDVCLSFNLPKIFAQHIATLLGQQSWMLLASFEQPLQQGCCEHILFTSWQFLSM